MTEVIPVHPSSFLLSASTMPDFIPVCKTSDIPDPGKDVFEVDERFIVIFHLEKQWYALDDCCTHDGGPLGQGQIDGYQIICPRHGAIRHPHRIGADDARRPCDARP